MSEQARFPEELTDFLFDYADEITRSFPHAEAIPMNLSIPYFESVMYLRARIRVLLPYFQISEALVDEVGNSVSERLLKEFQTADNNMVTRYEVSTQEEYRSIEHAPFGEKWYFEIFELFRQRMVTALNPARRYVWNLDRPADPNQSTLGDDESLECVHRVEINHVVPFQRLVINFFNYQME